MWTKIKGWLAPPVFEDEEKTRTAHLLNIILLGLIPASAILGTVVSFVLPAGDFRPALILGMSLALMGVYILAKFGYIKLSSTLVVLVLWAAFTFVIFQLGGVRAPIYGIYIIITLIAGLLLGVWAGVGVVAISVLAGVGFYFAEANGLIVYSAENYVPLAVLAAQTFMLVVTIVLIVVYVGQLNQTLEQLRHDERELTASNKELEAIRSTQEERIATRTRGLEIVTALSERLTGILDFDQLLNELVYQVKISFGYYHAHIYILDTQPQELIMTAGVGEAGAQMKAQGHHIALNAPTSLVARAARSGQVVNVDNVREAPDWLPNPLLPDTYSEMAVPITVDGQVAGVLDVQQDKINGFDESDADLLRSLANQVAVAIRNARLFDEVETALAEAQAAQERYVAQSWQVSRSDSKAREHLYIQPGMPELSEATLEAAEEKALTQKHPAIVPIDEYEDSPKPLVAPVSLGGQTIGALQLHKLDSEDTSKLWTEQDLEFIETILDQVALTAENLRLFEETRERAGREQTLREVTDKLRAVSNLDQLAKVASESLAEQLSATYVQLKLGKQSTKNQNGRTLNHKEESNA